MCALLFMPLQAREAPSARTSSECNLTDKWLSGKKKSFYDKYVSEKTFLLQQKPVWEAGSKVCFQQKSPGCILKFQLPPADPDKADIVRRAQPGGLRDTSLLQTASGTPLRP